MRRVCFFPPISSKLLIVFIISICMLSGASATLITGSSGSATIIGNDPCYTTGSFKVLVNYGVYDGTSTTDPLGITTDLQIAFVLQHLGSGGESPVLKFGRFTVFAPSDYSSTTIPFYSGASSVGTTGRAPSSINIDPPPNGISRVKFYFETGMEEALFASGETSKTLVVKTASGHLPASVILEINNTDTVPGVNGDISVNLVPEPTSMALFGIASFLLSLHRRRKT
jgi:hypothetical protein